MALASKTLHNSDVSGTRQNVPDVQVFGDGDTFRLVCKASSAAEGWMKSTKACVVARAGTIVQVTTQQGEQVSEALTWLPAVELEPLEEGGFRFVAMDFNADRNRP